MAYLNAREILPPELLKQIQQHLDGQLIYIPKKSAPQTWGAKRQPVVAAAAQPVDPPGVPPRPVFGLPGRPAAPVGRRHPQDHLCGKSAFTTVRASRQSAAVNRAQRPATMPWLAAITPAIRASGRLRGRPAHDQALATGDSATR